MQIFDVQIFGSDADWFVAQCKKDQKKWILAKTGQKDEALIDKFLENVNRGKDECTDCKKHKTTTNNGERKTVPAKAKSAPESQHTPLDSGGADDKGGIESQES